MRAGIDYDVFWRNSVVVAYFAQALAVIEHLDQDEAFTAGLVHNIGRLALAQQRPEDLHDATVEARARKCSVQDVQRARYGFTDAELGAAIADSWAFPIPLVDAIANHMSSLLDLPDRRGLDAVVIRARRMARAQGVDDGLDVITTRPMADVEWRSREAEQALRKFGGVAGILDRAGEFVGVPSDERYTA